jgi:hypothetical protein
VKVTRLLDDLTVTKRQDRRIRNLSIVVLLLVLVVSLFVAIGVRAISGENTQYVLEANRTGIGILILDNGASAILMEDSSWIGLIVSNSGRLIVEERATIIGPVCLFSDSLRLGENAKVRGSVYLLSGELMLEPGASVSREQASLEPRAGARKRLPGAKCPGQWRRILSQQHQSDLWIARCGLLPPAVAQANPPSCGSHSDTGAGAPSPSSTAPKRAGAR